MGKKSVILYIMLFFSLSINQLWGNNEFNKQKILDEYEDVLDKYTDILDDQEQIIGEAQEILKEYDSNTISEILNAGKIKLQKLREFLDTKITQIDFPAINYQNATVTPKVKVTYGDLIKTGFWISDLLADAWLKSKLSEQTTDYIFGKIKKDYINFLAVLEKYNSAQEQCNSKIIPNSTDKPYLNNQNSEIRKNLRTAKKELLEYVKKEHTLGFGKITKNIFFKKTILYILFFEFSNLFKERFLGTISPESFFEYVQQAASTNVAFDTIKISRSEPIPLFDLIKLFTQLYSWPLTTGVSITAKLFNFLVEQLGLKDYQAEDGTIKRKKLFDILDGNTVFALKKVALLLFSIKQITNKFQQTMWFEELKNEHEILINLIHNYKDLKQSLIARTNKKEIINQIKETEQQIKKFIKDKQKTFFRKWLMNKNFTFAKNEYLLNFALNIPSICLLIKWVYDKNKDGKLDLFKNLFNSEPISTTIFVVAVIGTCLGAGLLLTPSYY